MASQPSWFDPSSKPFTGVNEAMLKFKQSAMQATQSIKMHTGEYVLPYNAVTTYQYIADDGTVKLFDATELPGFHVEKSPSDRYRPLPKSYVHLDTEMNISDYVWVVRCQFAMKGYGKPPLYDPTYNDTGFEPLTYHPCDAKGTLVDLLVHKDPFKVEWVEFKYGKVPCQHWEPVEALDFG